MPLNPYLFPNSYLARSNPADVARSEDRTFVCLPDNEHLYLVPNSEIPSDLGFKWGCRAGEIDPETKKEMKTEQMRAVLMNRFKGCMKNRTMYIMPFSMGPICSEFAKLGIQITDSMYVIANMYIMTRTGLGVLEKIGQGAPFVPCWHSVGCPLEKGEKDVSWPCQVESKNKYIAHFMQPDPEHPLLGAYSIMSFGSGYGGNAILGKKCYALRIASKMARDDKVQWMAEHMLILRVIHTPILSVDPTTKKKTFGPQETYTITGAFPSACGKTNLAMIEVPDEFKDEWQVRCVGDDIAWIRVDSDGKLAAINPESGFFGVAPGTSDKTNKNAMQTLRGGNTIFTNVGVTKDGDVYWEGKEKTIPHNMITWKGVPLHDEGWKESSTPLDAAVEKQARKAFEKSIAHPNSRYTTPCAQCPIIDKDWNTGNGYAIDAMLFGGRRSTLMPLCIKADRWSQGVLLAATLRSEGTAAVQDRVVGSLSFDPFAMRPFIGYNGGDYFQHWLDMEKFAKHLPDIYLVNWFRKNDKGEFLWSGFSDNFRIIRWACLNAKAKREGSSSSSSSSTATPLGVIPTTNDLGLDLSAPHTHNILASPEILTLDAKTTERDKSWFDELYDRKRFLQVLSTDLPPAMKEEFNTLVHNFVKYGLAFPEGKKEEDLLL